MSAAKAFFDTNVLLYGYGPDREKRARAQALIAEYGLSGRLLLSTQVVQEFYVAGLRKMGLPRPVLQEAVGTLLSMPVVVISPLHITMAMQKEDDYGISFWDALILAAAETAGADVLYTEDLNDGQKYGPVTVRNPFGERA